MRTRDSAVLNWLDNRPYIEEYTIISCDDCKCKDESIYEYLGDELCIKCLIDRLSDERFVEVVLNGCCSGCGCEGKCYRYGGKEWCESCLIYELSNDKIIEEIC